MLECELFISNLSNLSKKRVELFAIPLPFPYWCFIDGIIMSCACMSCHVMAWHVMCVCHDWNLSCFCEWAFFHIWVLYLKTTFSLYPLIHAYVGFLRLAFAVRFFTLINRAEILKLRTKKKIWIYIPKDRSYLDLGCTRNGFLTLCPNL